MVLREKRGVVLGKVERGEANDSGISVDLVDDEVGIPWSVSVALVLVLESEMWRCEWSGEM